MDPVKFKGHNLVLAENQEEYRPLPVCHELTGNGAMVCCWKLSFWERVKLLFKGKIFIRQLTFNMPFQPMLPMIEWKDRTCTNCGRPVGEHKFKKQILLPS
jgi:hypothetical protein